jgi:hypothetical protein
MAEDSKGFDCLYVHGAVTRTMNSVATANRCGGMLATVCCEYFNANTAPLRKTIKDFSCSHNGPLFAELPFKLLRGRSRRHLGGERAAAGVQDHLQHGHLVHSWLNKKILVTRSFLAQLQYCVLLSILYSKNYNMRDVGTVFFFFLE